MAGQPSRNWRPTARILRCAAGATMVCVAAAMGACTPCAAVRADLERALREEAALVGVAGRTDAGWRVHGGLTIGHDVLQRLVGVLDSGAALPELRLEGGEGALAWVLRSTPQLASIAIGESEDGIPVILMRFVGGDASSLRLRGAPVAEPAFTEAIAQVPIALDPTDPTRVVADFGSSVVLDSVVLSAAVASAQPPLDVASPWRLELERVLRFDVGSVQLLSIGAPVGLELRLVGVHPGTRDSLVLTFVTSLRPAIAGELPREVDVPGSSLRLHPGIAEAWLRERTADSLARRTLDDSGRLDPSGDTVLGLDSAVLAGDQLRVAATLRCTGAPRCEVLDAPAAGRLVFGRDGVSIDLRGESRAAGWVALASEELAGLLNGFSIGMPDRAPIRLLPRTLDEEGGILLRVVDGE